MYKDIMPAATAICGFANVIMMIYICYLVVQNPDIFYSKYQAHKAIQITFLIVLLTSLYNCYLWLTR